MFDFGQVERMANAIEGSTLVRLPRTGHLAPRENPDAVNAAIDAFLGKRVAT